MRTREDWDKWSAQPNPWGTEGTEKDLVRIEILMDRLRHARFTDMLDIGCGEGVMTNVLSSLAGRTVGFDISPIAVERAKARFPSIDFREGELLNLIARPDLATEPFDLVLLSEVLYYLQSDEERQAAIAGLAKLGTPSCVFYFSVIVTGASTGRRYFTHDEFVSLVSQHFNIIDGFASVAEVPAAVALLLRLTPSRKARARLLKAWTTSRDVPGTRHMAYLAVKRALPPSTP